MDLVARLQQELPPLPRWMGITVTVGRTRIGWLPN